MSAPFDHPLPGVAPAWQVAVGVALGVAGVACLLPRPRHRQIAVGTFLTLASAVVLGLFVATTFGGPSRRTLDDRIFAGLFWLFASVAVSFAVVMVAQRNPARGAMAFAVSVLATCGLFLLLAAPFLMAATVVVYAGATIVTFLFVLMLSHAGGPSDENDRSREPLLGSVGGLGFAGLILFGLYLGSPARAGVRYPLPAEPVTPAESEVLREASAKLRAGETDQFPRIAETARGIADRLKGTPGEKPRQVAAEADALAVLAQRPGEQAFVAGEALKLAGRGSLPARNVAGIGYLLYSEHLLAVELAGTLLLVATVGAVAVAGRRRQA
jgi:NADH:ubiquinone oxidoreductase subunit 6 (subunit J)